jgi:hypothetical protein
MSQALAGAEIALCLLLFTCLHAVHPLAAASRGEARRA